MHFSTVAYRMWVILGRIRIRLVLGLQPLEQPIPKGSPGRGDRVIGADVFRITAKKTYINF
jgi:hypothetical protein